MLDGFKKKTTPSMPRYRLLPKEHFSFIDDPVLSIFCALAFMLELTGSILFSMLLGVFWSGEKGYPVSSNIDAS